MPHVAFVLGSDSDWPIVQNGYTLLREFGLDVDVLVASAHRTPEDVHSFVKHAPDKGIRVIIAAAGSAAHLPGVIAAYTTLPVIGIPISSSPLQGMDALLSIAQMPPGVPVATMSINGGKNAALYAVSILALGDPALAKKLTQFRAQQAEQVHQKNHALQTQLTQQG